MTTKLSEAREALAALEGKIAGLQAERRACFAELSGLKETSPDDQARKVALRAALDALADELQKLQNQETDRARQRIRDLESERENLAGFIAQIETRAAPYGVDTLVEVERTAHSLVSIFRRCGNPEGLEYDRQALAVMLWARDLRAEVASIPNWRARLAEFGD